MKKIISLAAGFTPFAASAFTGPPGSVTTPPVTTGVTNISDFYDIIVIAARWLVVFGIIIGAVFIIWGGIQYMTAGGDESGTSAAKSKIIGGLIGIALVLLAYALVNIIGTFLTGSTVVSP